MTPDQAAKPDVLTAELRRRLEEAEETIRAIREGEIDALLIRGQREDEVFTLAGGTESYKSFMDAMSLGAAAFDGSRRLLYANNALADLLGCGMEELHEPGGLFVAFPADVRPAVESIVEAGIEQKHSALISCVLQGAEFHLMIASTPLPLGPVTGIAVTFTDFTQRVKAAAAEESERTARAVLASANEAVVVCDNDGAITHVNAAIEALYQGDLIGRRFDEAIPLVFTQATGILQPSDMIALAIGGHPVQGMEATFTTSTRTTDLLVSAAPLRVTGEKVSGCVVTLVDLSQRKAAEKQQNLLMAELDHRVKNTLALVLSICNQTLIREDSLEAFQIAFVARIQALSATHNLLAERSWSNLLIDELIQAEIAPYLPLTSERIRLEGLRVHVAPRAAIALGLVLHELATNAVKYGALSNLEGSVTVRNRSAAGEDGALVLEWSEQGGPPVPAEPSRKGFGRTVISRSLQYLPGGGADMDFQPGGLVCTVRVPREDVYSS